MTTTLFETLVSNNRKNRWTIALSFQRVKTVMPIVKKFITANNRGLVSLKQRAGGTGHTFRWSKRETGLRPDLFQAAVLFACALGQNSLELLEPGLDSSFVIAAQPIVFERLLELVGCQGNVPKQKV